MAKFAEVIECLKNGGTAQRIAWDVNGDKEIMMQIPQRIAKDIVPKMTSVQDIVKTLDGTLVAGGDSDRAVGAVVANDLMSDVLLHDADDILLITSLASDQAIRTAHIVGAMGVVVHNAKPLSETMLKVANDLAIPLVSSPLSKYDACVRLHDAFLAEERG